MLRVVLFFDAIPAAFLAHVLAQQLPVFGIEDANVKLIPLHIHLSSDPAWRQAVVGGFDFDATVQMHDPLAMLVIAKRFQGQRQQGRFFFGKHGGDLPFGGAVNAGIGTAGLPTIQIGLGLFQTLKAFSFEWFFWAWPTPDSTFPFRSGSLIRQGRATAP